MMMTSDDFEESLRKNCVMLIKKDGSHMEIPSGFLKQQTAFCIEEAEKMITTHLEAVFHAAVEYGMKYGARLTAELLK